MGSDYEIEINRRAWERRFAKAMNRANGRAERQEVLNRYRGPGGYIPLVMSIVKPKAKVSRGK